MFYEIWFKMDEDLTIVNQNTRNESITSFLKKNLKKIILILFSLIIFLIFLFIYQELKERKKNRLAEWDCECERSNLFNTCLVLHYR